MNMIAAAAVLASLSVLPTPALAQNDGHAQLRLTVVNETNKPLPNVTVTVFTIQGERIVTTDEKGVAVLADLPVASTEWWARSENLSNADAARLKPGKNSQTLTLHSDRPLAGKDSSESGS